MPICLTCGKYFGKIFIDGKPSSSRGRKRCLSCVPFGLTKRKEMVGDCVCSVCNRNYTYDRKKGNIKTKCGNCSVNDRRRGVKRREIEYKGGKCQICGYGKCDRALKFHHLDPSVKKFEIGGNHCRKWEDLVLELDKCLLVCGNCHDEVHEGLVDLSSFRSPQQDLNLH